MSRTQFSLRTVLTAVAVVARVLWLHRLSPLLLVTFAGLFLVYPALTNGQSDAVKGLLPYAAVVLLFGGFCFLIARLMLIFY